MAAFGAKYIKFAKISAEESGKLPTYDKENTVSLGALVKADMTPNYASGDMYADDKLAERVNEFVSATIAVEVDELNDETAVVIYGAKLNDLKEKVDNANDNAPYGGLAYYKTLMKNNKKFWRGYYYPKAKAAIGNDSAATKSSSITFGTTPISFTVQEPETGEWRYTKEFTSEAEAIKWVDGKLSNKEITESQPESEETGNSENEVTE